MKSTKTAEHVLMDFTIFPIWTHPPLFNWLVTQNLPILHFLPLPRDCCCPDLTLLEFILLKGWSKTNATNIILEQGMIAIIYTWLAVPPCSRQWADEVVSFSPILIQEQSIYQCIRYNSIGSLHSIKLEKLSCGEGKSMFLTLVGTYVMVECIVSDFYMPIILH